MSNTVTAENASKKQKSIAQIVLSLIVFAGFVVLLFVRNAATYDKTLFNLVLDVFKGNYTDSLSLKYTLFAFVGSYAILLICTVLSFFTSKRGAAGLNLFKTFIAGGVASAFALLLIRSGKTASEVFYDSATYVALNSTVLMMIFGAVMLLILSIGTYKKAAALKILFVIIAAAFFVFANKLYIRDYTLFDMLGTVSVTGGKADKIAKIVFAAFGWIIVANAALAMLSLCLRKCAAIDYIRTIALFVGVVAGVVMTILYESFGKLFSTSYLGMLSALILTVVQVALLIISTIVKAKRAKAKGCRRG